jgi:hypothetical protein
MSGVGGIKSLSETDLVWEVNFVYFHRGFLRPIMFPYKLGAILDF